MGFNNKKIFTGKEIIFNNFGQIKLKKRFIYFTIVNYYRFLLK